MFSLLFRTGGRKKNLVPDLNTCFFLQNYIFSLDNGIEKFCENTENNIGLTTEFISGLI